MGGGMSSEVSTRRAAASDAAAIAALLGQLGYPTPAEEVPARLVAMDPSTNAVFLTTNSGDVPVGLVAVHSMSALHAREPVAMIMALVVAPEGRGRGIGRELVRAAEEWARSRGCERLMVTSAEHRSDAHAFYPACGMPYTGRRFAKRLR